MTIEAGKTYLIKLDGTRLKVRTIRPSDVHGCWECVSIRSGVKLTGPEHAFENVAE